MGVSRRMRQAYQHIHGGPMPAGQQPPVAVQLTILITPALRDAIDAEFERMAKPKERPVTRQDFLEKLLFGGFNSYMQWKAKQEADSALVKLAAPTDLAALAAKGVVN
jgi:hypothetical protein